MPPSLHSPPRYSTRKQASRTNRHIKLKRDTDTRRWSGAWTRSGLGCCVRQNDGRLDRIVIFSRVRRTIPRAPLSLSALASDALLEQAFAWLCQRRKRYPPHADVWNLRRSWPTEKARIQHELRTGIYQFGLLDRVTCVRDGQREDMDLWAARDAVVLKALSLLLPTVLPFSKRCTHLKDHGGAKYAVRQVVAPGSGKSERVYESLTPRRNSSPSVVTMTVVLANSTPSAYATTVCTPSPSRFQLYSNPKPLSVSPHTWRVSPRLVP